MPHVELHGQNIYYEDTGGDGPAIIFGHGFLMTHAMFEPQVRALRSKYRVIVHDQRGFGQTITDGKPFTYWDCADDAVRLCEYLGVTKAVFGGMSQGGFVSLRVALRYPERVQALVLIATEAGVTTPEEAAGQQQLLDTWTSYGPIEPLRAAIADTILGDKAHWEPWHSMWATLSKDALSLPGQCLAERDDITDRLGEIHAPAIVFFGTGDKAIPIERGRDLAQKLPRCKKYVEIPHGTHAVSYINPDAVNGPLLAFLQEFAH